MLFEGAGTNTGDKTIEDKFFEHEVRLYRKKRKYNENANSLFRLNSIQTHFFVNFISVFSMLI